MSEINGKKRRRFKNIFIEPKAQVQYGLYFLAFGLLLMALALGFVFRTVSDMVSILGLDSSGTENAREILNQTMFSLWIIFGVVAVCFASAAIVIVFVITHRFFGPMVPIRRHIESLKSGDYSSRVKLRKDDQLHPIADELNELAGLLERKYGAGSASASSSLAQ